MVAGAGGADGFFTWGTNIEEVQARILSGLAAIEARMRQAATAAGQGAPAGTFLDQLNARIQTVGESAVRRYEKVHRDFEAAARKAQTTGQPFRLPGGQTLVQHANAIAENAGRDMQRTLQTALNVIPPGLRQHIDPARIARAGAQSIATELQRVFAQTRDSLAAIGVRPGGQPGIMRRLAPTAAQPTVKPGSLEHQAALADWNRGVMPGGGPVSPAAKRVLREGLIQSEEQLSRALEAKIRANVDEATGRIKNIHGARALGRGFVVDELGAFFRSTQGGVGARPVVPRSLEAGEAERLRLEKIEAETRRGGVTQTRAQIEDEKRQGRQELDQRRLAAKHEQALKQNQARELAAQNVQMRTQRQLGGEINNALQRQWGRQIREGLDVGTVEQLGGSRRYRMGGQFFEGTRRGVQPIREEEALARAQRDYAQQLRRQMQQQQRAAGPAGPVGPGGFGPGGGGGFFGAAFDKGGLSPEGIIGAGARLVRYTALAAAIGGLLAIMRDTKREAVDFAESLTDLEVAVGRNTTVSQSWIVELQGIARLAGANVAQAMDTAARGVRAFSNVMVDSQQEIRDVGTATARAAERLAIIAGKEIGNATGDIIAIGSSYGLAADELERINQAVAGAKFLGGSPEQVAQGLSNGATAFIEAGFTLNEAASIISVVQARLDQTGQATATRLARVFQIARGASAQAALASAGVDTGGTVASQLKQFAQLIEAGQVSDQQRRSVVYSLGGTANTRELLALLTNYGLVQANVNALVLEGGRANEEYQRKIDNLSGLLRKIAGDLAGIQTGIVQSGLLAPLGAVLRLLEPSLRTLSDLLGLWNRLPDAVRAAAGAYLMFAGAQAVLARVNVARTASAVAAGLPAPQAFGARLFQPMFGPNAVSRLAPGAALPGGPVGPVGLRTPLPILNPQSVRDLGNQTRLFDRATSRFGDAVRGVTGRRIVGHVIDPTTGTGGAYGSVRGFAPGAFGRAGAGLGGALGRAGAGLAGFAASPAGIIVGIMAMVAAFQAVRDAMDRMDKSASDAASALTSLGTAASVQERLNAAQALSAAAQARRAAVEGAAGRFAGQLEAGGALGMGELTDWESVRARVIESLNPLTATADQAGAVLGSIIGLFTGATWRSVTDQRRFGDDAVRDARLLDEAARIEMDRAQRLEQALAAQGRAGSAMFGGPLRSVEQLKVGMERLSLAGANAETTINAITEALFGLGQMPEGFLPEQGGLQFAADIAGQSVDLIRHAVAGYTPEGVTTRRAEQREQLEAAQRDLGAARGPEAVRAAQERIDRIREQMNEFDQEIAKALEDASRELQRYGLDDPDEMARFREDAQALIEGYVTEIGAEGRIVTPDERAELARRLSSLLAGAEGIDPETRQLIIDTFVNAITGRLSYTLDGIDEATSNAIQLAYIGQARDAARLVELNTGDKVAAAQAQLRAAGKALGVARRAGQPVSDATHIAMREGQIAVQNAISARATAFSNMRVALLDEADVWGRAVIEMNETNRLIRHAHSQGNIEEVARLRGQRATQAREMIRQEIARQSSERLAALDPRNVLGQSRVEVINASQILNNTQRLDSAGRVTKAFSDALRDYNEKMRAYINAQVAVANALNIARTDPRDEVANARVAVENAALVLGNALPGQEAYYNAWRQVIEAQIALARTVQARTAAQRVSRIDPRADISLAEEGLRDLRERLALELPNAKAHADLITEIATAELELVRLRTETAQAARRAGTDPRSQVENARLDMIAAAEDLALTLAGTQAFYDALGTLIESQIALGDAVAAAQGVTRQLAGDISDPVFRANEDLRAAQEAFERARSRGAAIDEQDRLALDVRQAELGAEDAAFQQRFRDMQVARDLGRITHAQYVAYLQEEAARLRAIADRTRQQQEQLDQVELAIKSVTDSASSGLFNLGDIRVPTPFEVRRMLSAATGGLIGIDGQFIGAEGRQDPLGLLVTGSQRTVIEFGRELGAAALDFSKGLHAILTDAFAILYRGAETDRQSSYSDVRIDINGADINEVKTVLRDVLGPAAYARQGGMAARKF